MALGRDSNLFGGSFDMCETPDLLKIEEQSLDTVFLFISDVALDNSRVLAGLRHIWKGFLEDGVVPAVVILMGNFLSHPFGQKPDDVSTLCDKFGELGAMVKDEFEELIDKTTFVLVLGPNDPGPGNVLPRPPMPQMFTKRFVETLGSGTVHLAANPCRIRFITQEIVVLRDDLMQKMIRHCAVKPDLTEAGLMHAHLVKTVSDQSYLTPLPISARPVLWAHDHGLWLFPTPHVTVLADRVDSYICKYEKTLGMNPGSFKTDFSFLVYLPAEKRAQQSSLNSEDTQTLEQEEVRLREEESAMSLHEEDELVSDDHSEQIEAGQKTPISRDDASPVSEEEAPRLFETEPDVPQLGPARLVRPEDDIESNSVKHDISEKSDIQGEKNGRRQSSEATEQVETNSEPDRNLDATEGSEHADNEESDDDSHLEPAEGVKRLDIKTLVRNSLVEDSHWMPEFDRDSDSAGE
ncbi:DNA polymerase epsilon subunit B [Gracilaria domingensis]|nr:DNA polymerase epsilon subunit B [Gracilaria domingensis]